MIWSSNRADGTGCAYNDSQRLGGGGIPRLHSGIELGSEPRTFPVFSVLTGSIVSTSSGTGVSGLYTIASTGSSNSTTTSSPWHKTIVAGSNSLT